MLLARAGLDVLVVDRMQYGQDTTSTHSLMRGGVLQLHRWGLLDDIIAAGTPALHQTTFHVGDDTILDRLEVPSRRRRALLAPPHRARPDPRRRRGVRRRHCAFRRHRAGSDQASSTAGCGASSVKTTAARPSKQRAKIVVGADGIGSNVARWVDAPVERSGSSASAFAYGYWTGMETDGYELYLPSGSIGRCDPDEQRRRRASLWAPDRTGSAASS